MLGSLGANYTEDVILAPAAVPCCFFYPETRHHFKDKGFGSRDEGNVGCV